jgi:integrase
MTATSNGTVFPRCACRSAVTGRQLGARCPRRGLVGHGRWYIDAHVPGPDGRQKRLRRGGFASRAAAEQGLADLLELAGPDAMAETWTMKRWLQYWLSLSEDRLRPSALRAYRSVTRTHLIPWLGRFRVADLDGRRGVKTVQRAVDAVSRQEVADGELIAPGTVHRVVAVLRSALSEARHQGLVSTNAAWRLRLPRGARPLAVAWTREREKLWRATGAKPPVAVWEVDHVAEFLDAVQDDPLFPLWWLIALRGLRRGEAVAVRGSDLDERYHELSVQRQLLVIDGKVHLGPPKSAAGYAHWRWTSSPTSYYASRNAHSSAGSPGRTAIHTATCSPIPTGGPCGRTGSPIASTPWSANSDCHRSGCTTYDTARPALPAPPGSS